MMLDFAEKYDMLPQGARVLVAVSGGADSVCLLNLLKAQESKLGISVFAAHYEHGIRGAEALRDAAFTEELCRKLSVPCIVGHGNVPEYAKAHSLGTEEAARELRYAFLEECRVHFNCDRIATAHNADDNAETVIFNLTRGSGAVRGIPPVRGVFIRPLLGTTRREIEEYLAANGIEHIEDSTNAQDEYSRNVLRHRVMPVLREINPAAAKAFMQAAEISAADEEYLNGEAKRFIEENLNGAVLPRKKLSALPKALKSRVIRQMCPRTLTLSQVEEVIKLLSETEHKRIMLPGTEIVIEQGRVQFGVTDSVRIPERVIAPGENVLIPELGVSIYAEFTQKHEEIHDLFKTFYFKSENICGTIICTARKPGDKLRPAGRGCTKTLKSLFLEAGYTRQERDETLIIRDEKGILAVCGLAQDERSIAAAGDEVLRIDIERRNVNNE